MGGSMARSITLSLGSTLENATTAILTILLAIHFLFSGSLLEHLAILPSRSKICVNQLWSCIIAL